MPFEQTVSPQSGIRVSSFTYKQLSIKESEKGDGYIINHEVEFLDPKCKKATIFLHLFADGLSTYRNFVARDVVLLNSEETIGTIRAQHRLQLEPATYEIWVGFLDSERERLPIPGTVDGRAYIGQVSVPSGIGFRLERSSPLVPANRDHLIQDVLALPAHKGARRLGAL